MNIFIGIDKLCRNMSVSVYFYAIKEKCVGHYFMANPHCKMAIFKKFSNESTNALFEVTITKYLHGDNYEL